MTQDLKKKSKYNKNKGNNSNLNYQDLCLKGEEIPNNISSAKTPKQQSSNRPTVQNSNNSANNHVKKLSKNKQSYEQERVGDKSYGKNFDKMRLDSEENEHRRSIDYINPNDNKYEFYRFKSHIDSMKNTTQSSNQNNAVNKSSMSRSRHSIDSANSKYSNRSKISKNSVRSTNNNTESILTSNIQAVLNPKYPHNQPTNNKSSHVSLISETSHKNYEKKYIPQAKNATSINYYQNGNTMENYNNPKKSAKAGYSSNNARNTGYSTYEKALKSKDNRYNSTGQSNQERLRDLISPKTQGEKSNRNKASEKDYYSSEVYNLTSNIDPGLLNKPSLYEKVQNNHIVSNSAEPDRHKKLRNNILRRILNENEEEDSFTRNEANYGTEEPKIKKDYSFEYYNSLKGRENKAKVDRLANNGYSRSVSKESRRQVSIENFSADKINVTRLLDDYKYHSNNSLQNNQPYMVNLDRENSPRKYKASNNVYINC